MFCSKEFHYLSKHYPYENVCFGLSNMFPLVLVPSPHLWLYKFKSYISSTTFTTLKDSSLINFLCAPSITLIFLIPLFFVHFHFLTSEIRDQSMKNIQHRGTTVIL